MPAFHIMGDALYSKAHAKCHIEINDGSDSMCRDTQLMNQ